MTKPLKERKTQDRPMHNRNKILPNQNLINAFVELYQLEKLTMDTMKEYQKTYVVIRMVTIVEQFFREIVKLKIHKKPKLIPDKKFILTKSLVIDAFRQGGRGWPGGDGVDYGQLVEDFITKNPDDVQNLPASGSISMKPHIIDKLIEHVSRHHTLLLKELLISSSFSFQNIYSIKKEMKCLDISVFSNERVPTGF